MKLINLTALDNFAIKHSDARKSLSVWKQMVLTANWKMKQDVLLDFPKAKMLRNNRGRFEILHNKYRLIAEVDYEDAFVHIRFIGTHAAYDKINPETI